ncbi:MAG: TIGR00725 family protein [Anaerolineales bacterium]|nr:MAG: TIGR00725 family protein [Anaerolineales bacterium]
MDHQRPIIIGVIGGRRATSAEEQAAQVVGERIAQAGAVLICGGCLGVMEASCRGAKDGGGLTIGVLPGNSREAANPYVDLPIVTGIGEARNSIIARTAHAVVAIGGSYGTLSEIAYSVAFGTPVVGLGTWHMEREGHAPSPIVRAATPEEAAKRALELAQERQDAAS